MEHREGRFEGAEGLEIFWQAWLPDGEPRATLVLVHGASEHGGRYGHVVDRLVPEGYAIWALDHRGHGRSEGRRAFLDRLDNVLADLDRFVDIVSAESPGSAKPLMLGHSMGGCIATAYTLRHQEKLAALVLSAPLLTLGAASARTRAVSRALSRIAPGARLFKVDSSKISRDPDEVRAYDEDPLVTRSGLPARTLSELVYAIDSFPGQARRLELPLLIMHGSGDQIVPVDGSTMLHDRASSEDKTMKLYDGLYHEMFNELEDDRRRVLDDLSGWLGARVPLRA